MGGSNGGLLMGAMITQHPELARAVVSLVGLYDMLRVERTPNGAFNVPEFGSVRDPALFGVLYAYSPYHRVKAGTAYPSILMATGENDPRVDSWHSRKMVASLQAATSASFPILLRTNHSAGHGRGGPGRGHAALRADRRIHRRAGVLTSGTRLSGGDTLLIRSNSVCPGTNFFFPIKAVSGELCRKKEVCPRAAMGV
jgi:prolyl oligopeptidase PreP (S9A serine peptidase family)